MIVASGVGRVVTDLEEKNGFSRCRFAFRAGKEDQYVGLKFWHNTVNMNALQYIKKGKELFVSGGLSIHEYEGKTYVDISVNNFTFLNSGPKPTKPQETEASSDTQEGDIPF